MFDVVIVNHNSTRFLVMALRSVEACRRDCRLGKIVVVDNASREDVEGALGEFPEVLLYRNGKNVGFAKAVNFAARLGRAPYILFMNPDTLIHPRFFQKIGRFLDLSPSVGVVGPAVLDPDGRIQGSARAFPSVATGVFGRRSLLTRLFPGNGMSRRNIQTWKTDGKTPVEVDWVSGACMVVRREAFERVGGMDEQFFLYWEDADLCRRMWSQGWKVIYHPAVKATHLVGASSATNRVKASAYFHQSAFLYFRKHGGSWRRIWLPMAWGVLSVRFALTLGGSWISRKARREWSSSFPPVPRVRG